MNVCEGGDAFLSLFDLEMVYVSLEHAVFLDSLFEAGIKGRAWRIISCIYNNLQAVVSSGQSLSEHSIYHMVYSKAQSFLPPFHMHNRTSQLILSHIFTACENTFSVTFCKVRD